MTDAPDGTVRFMAFVFWMGLGAIAAFSDPIYGYLRLHWKTGIAAIVLWVLFGVLFAASKLFRSARLTMRFIEGKSPYQESDVMQIDNEICNAVHYRLSIESDKSAQVTVTVDVVSLDGYERHDIPLHRMGDRTNEETITEVSRGRPRYWDVLTYVRHRQFLRMYHLQSNRSQILYPMSQAFTVIASAPGTRTVKQKAVVKTDDEGNLSFCLE